MINFAEARIQGQVAGPGTLFTVPGVKDRNGKDMVVLKVPVMVNPRRRKKGASASERKGKAYTVAIWSRGRVLNFLQHCPPGTQIHVRGTLNHDGRKDEETGEWTQYASINALDLDFGMRSQKGLAATQNTYFIYGKEGRVEKKVDLVPIPANARAALPESHQVAAPASVDDIEAGLTADEAAGQGFELTA